MSDKPELLDYIWLFESEPEWVHEMGWFYGARFDTERGKDRIVATVAPDEAEFSLEWHQAERCLIKLKLVMITDWVIQRTAQSERLLLNATPNRATLFILTLKPDVAINLESQW